MDRSDEDLVQIGQSFFQSLSSFAFNISRFPLQNHAETLLHLIRRFIRKGDRRNPPDLSRSGLDERQQSADQTGCLTRACTGFYQKGRVQFL
ncbi:hypothetical protein D3C76_798710 [compost metagenome]